MFKIALAAPLCLWLGTCAVGQETGVSPIPDAERFLIRKEGRYGYIDKTGTIVIPAIYTVAHEFHENRALFGRDWFWKYGFLDEAGREVIPMQGVWSAVFSEGLASVEITLTNERSQGKIGFIDPNGRWVIMQDQARFKGAGEFKGGLATATSETTGQKIGFISKQGAWAIAPQFDWAEPFSEGLAAVEVGGKRGFIDRAGTLVIPASFREAHSFAGGLALVYRETGKPLFIDHAGQVVIDIHVDFADAFTDRWSVVMVGGKFGYMDKTGTFAIAPQYAQAARFSEGLAAVRIGNNWGFINRNAELVIPARFEVTPGGAPGPFRSGLARVFSRIPNDTEMNAWAMAGLDIGYITTKGDYVWPPTH